MNWFHPKISLKKWLEDAVRNSIEIPESSRKSCHERRNALKSRAKLPSINQPWKNHENSKIVPVTTPDSNKAQSYDFWSLFEMPWPSNTWFTTLNLKKKTILKLCKKSKPNPTQIQIPKSRLLTCLDYSQPHPRVSGLNFWFCRISWEAANKARWHAKSTEINSVGHDLDGWKTSFRFLLGRDGLFSGAKLLVSGRKLTENRSWIHAIICWINWWNYWWNVINMDPSFVGPTGTFLHLF